MTTIDADKLPTLTAQRVALRWLEHSDAPALFEVFSDRQAMRYWSSLPWTDASEGVAMIDSVRRHFADRSLYQWGVALRRDDTIIGTCTLAGIDVQNRRAEIGFILRSDHWRKGYMSEAIRALLHFAFQDLDMHRIEADVDPRNEASIRLLERLGFQREGYLRERWLVGEEINDTVFYGLLAASWRSPIRPAE